MLRLEQSLVLHKVESMIVAFDSQGFPGSFGAGGAGNQCQHPRPDYWANGCL